MANIFSALQREQLDINKQMEYASAVHWTDSVSEAE